MRTCALRCHRLCQPCLHLAATCFRVHGAGVVVPIRGVLAHVCRQHFTRLVVGCAAGCCGDGHVVQVGYVPGDYSMRHEVCLRQVVLSACGAHHAVVLGGRHPHILCRFFLVGGYFIPRFSVFLFIVHGVFFVVPSARHAALQEALARAADRGHRSSMRFVLVLLFGSFPLLCYMACGHVVLMWCNVVHCVLVALVGTCCFFVLDMSCFSLMLCIFFDALLCLRREAHAQVLQFGLPLFPRVLRCKVTEVVHLLIDVRVWICMRWGHDDNVAGLGVAHVTCRFRCKAPRFDFWVEFWLVQGECVIMTFPCRLDFVLPQRAMSSFSSH